MSDATVKEPMVHVVKRDQIPLWKGILVRLIGVALALIVCALFIFVVTGLNPFKVYEGIWNGAMGSSRRMWITFRDAAILLCVGLAIAPAFRMRFWNIGAEGQIMVGATVSAAFMIYGASWSPALLYPLMVVGGVLAGVLWGVIPAFFKAQWNTNETLFTLMLNYIAFQIARYCIIFWENPVGSCVVGTINPDTKAGWLPDVFGNKYLLTVLIVLVLAVLLYVYMRYTKQGYEVAVVGESERTARYAGINVKKVIIRTMAISGGLAGLAGYLLVSGAGHTVSQSLSDNRGFTAIVVAWLGKLNPFMMLLVAFLLVFLERGSIEIATQFGLNDSASDVITGIILFFVLGCEFFINYRLEFRASRREEAAKA